MQQFPGFSVPQFGCLIKGPGRHSVSVRIVESYCVDHVFVSLQSADFLALISVPHFAGSIVAASDKPVAIFIECAVCERKQMSAQGFKQLKALDLIGFNLVNQFLY